MNWQMFWENLFYSSIAVLLFVIVGIIIMQVGYRRNIKKKKNFYSTLHSDLKPGVTVIFSNGIYGVIKRIDAETADIQVKSGAIITISRFVISSIEKDL